MLLQTCILVLPIVVAAARRSYNLTALFGPELSPGAQILYPTAPNYDQEVTQRWSLYDPPTFVATIKPATNQDVQNIVKTATKYHIPFFVTGGAHGAEQGFATVKNAVNIDLGNFNSTALDVPNKLLTVGGSTTFSQFYDLLYNNGLEIQTGNAPCVNMVGATIGAGVGPLQGLHGLVLDALVSVEMITATGDLITVSSTQYPDLFWAIRGAGANFGIITSATYGVHDHTNNGQVVNADFVFPAAANLSLFEVLQSYDDNLPPELAIDIGISYNNVTNGINLFANLLYYGTQEAFKPHLDKMLSLNPLRYQNITVGWNQVTKVAGFGRAQAVCVRGTYTNHYGVGAGRTDPATFSQFVQNLTVFSAANPWFSGAFSIQRYDTTATLAVPESQRGVYPWRDIKMQLIFENTYPDSSYDATVNAWMRPIRDAFFAVSGFPSLEVYINYAFGDEGPDVWFGSQNLPRLVQLKQIWDPKGLFGQGNPVPLELED